MIKLVNIKTTIPIYNLRPPILGNKTKIELSVGNILACIYSGARVEEVLSTGKTVSLNLRNYNTVNEVEVKEDIKVKEEIKVEPKVEPKKEEVKAKEATVKPVEVEDIETFIDDKKEIKKEMYKSNNNSHKK